MFPDCGRRAHQPKCSLADHHIRAAISVAIGAVWLAWAFFNKRSLRPVLALLFMGILGNAATCVALSAVAHRHEARVAWLIPLFALALLAATTGPAGERRGRCWLELALGQARQCAFHLQRHAFDLGV